MGAYTDFQGVTAGPALARALEREYSSIWIQGVGGDYAATIAPNMLPAGTDRGSIAEAKGLFEMAHEKCPDAAIVTGGYR